MSNRECRGLWKAALAAVAAVPIACATPRNESVADAAPSAEAAPAAAPPAAPPDATAGSSALPDGPAPAPLPVADAAPSVAADGPAGADAPPSDAAPAATAVPGTIFWQAYLSGAAVGPALDRDGNIVVAASTSPAGNQELALAKYAQSGDRLWLKEYGGAGDQVAAAFTLAPDGSMLVTGEFNAPTDFGGQTRTPVGGAGDRDVFLAAYSAEGTLQRVLTFGGPKVEAGRGVLVDPAGDWFLSGWGGPLMAGTQTVNGNFLIRVSPAGQVRWAVPGGEELLALAGDGDLVTGGYIAGRQLVRHTRAGATVWSKDLGADATVGELVLDSSGNLLTTVAFGGTITLGNQTLTSAGARDAALVTFASANGDVLWARPLLSSQGEDGGFALCREASGDILVGGSYGGSDRFQAGEPKMAASIGWAGRYAADGTRRSIRALSFANGFVFGLLCDNPGGAIVTYNGGLAKMAL